MRPTIPLYAHRLGRGYGATACRRVGWEGLRRLDFPGRPELPPPWLPDGPRWIDREAASRHLACAPRHCLNRSRCSSVLDGRRHCWAPGYPLVIGQLRRTVRGHDPVAWRGHRMDRSPIGGGLGAGSRARIMSTVDTGTKDALRAAQELVLKASEAGDLDQRRAPMLEALRAFH